MEFQIAAVLKSCANLVQFDFHLVSSWFAWLHHLPSEQQFYGRADVPPSVGAGMQNGFVNFLPMRAIPFYSCACLHSVVMVGAECRLNYWLAASRLHRFLGQKMGKIITCQAECVVEFNHTARLKTCDCEIPHAVRRGHVRARRPLADLQVLASSMAARRGWRSQRSQPVASWSALRAGAVRGHGAAAWYGRTVVEAFDRLMGRDATDGPGPALRCAVRAVLQLAGAGDDADRLPGAIHRST